MAFLFAAEGSEAIELCICIVRNRPQRIDNPAAQLRGYTMFCPKCGQQQVSDEMRFCPRCGLQLGAVAALLGGHALTPTNAAATETQAVKLSPRKRGIRRGAKLMFLSGALLPVAIGLSFLVEEPGPLLLPVIVFMAGLMWMLYSRLFGEESLPTSQPTSQAQLNSAQQGFLPPPQSVPVSDFNKTPARTAEMVRPPSVTENTTRLLDENQN
jgi:hypothetical protein